MPAPSTDKILSQRQTSLTYWQEAHNRIELLLEAYHGNFQKLWPGEFRRGEEPKIANWFKLATERYKGMVGKVPKNWVMPSSVRRLSQTKADTIEKILAYYDSLSDMNRLMKRYAFWLVVGGLAPIGVVPDATVRTPRLIVRDPRTVLPAPGAGSRPGTSTAFGMMSKPLMTSQSLHSVIINETVTSTYLLDQYGTDDETMARLLKLVDADPKNLATPYNHLIYMDKDWWVVLIQQQAFLQVEHGLGLVPFRMTEMEIPDQLGGQGMFEQNIGLMLAYMRLLNQKLTYNENIVWPWLVIRGLSDIDHQSRVIEIMSQDGNAEFLAPPGNPQVERDLEVLDRLIRVMNRDTEAMQGEAPGSIITGPSVRELNRDVTTVVQDHWDIMKPDLEFVKSAALAMDENLYGGIKKEMVGRVKGEQFEQSYTPAKDIAGHYNVAIDFGLGLGGPEGFVELMQAAAQGYMDEQTVMEHLPWVRSVSETRRKVLLDRLEKVLLELMAGGAPTEIVNHISQWHEAVQSKKDPWLWLQENPMPIPGMPEGPMGPEGGGMVPPEAPAPQIPSTPTPAQLLSLVQGRRR